MLPTVQSKHILGPSMWEHTIYSLDKLLHDCCDSNRSSDGREHISKRILSRFNNVEYKTFLVPVILKSGEIEHACQSAFLHFCAWVWPNFPGKYRLPKVMRVVTQQYVEISSTWGRVSVYRSSWTWLGLGGRVGRGISRQFLCLL